MKPSRNKPFILHLVLSITLAAVITACGGGGGSGSTKPPPANVAPSVNAGADQTVDEETSVTLIGSGADSDGSISSYSWTQAAGTSVTLNNANTASVNFDAPTTTTQLTLTFQLTVTDNDGASASDTILITVAPVNAAPTASAGEDQIVYRLLQVTLSGSGADTDGSIVSYIWTQNAGTVVTLTNGDTETAIFAAPDVSDDEILTFELTVTDNEGSTTTDTVSITVKWNTPPIASAGIAQFVTSGDTVSLDASASTDEESGVTFGWIQSDDTGMNIALDDINAEQPIFTAPTVTAAQTITFKITVTDSEGLYDSATVNIAISPVITQKINDTGILLCGDYALGASENHSYSENCTDVTDVDGDTIPDGQDAEYGRDVTAYDDADGRAGFTFTKLDTNGDPLPQSATNWSCVRDNVTGLIWEVKTTDGGLQDMLNTYTWYNSTGINDGGETGTQNGGSCQDTDNCDTEKYIGRINASNAGKGLCGATDWQLPNREQLRSILDYSITSPELLIDTDYFPNTQGYNYATSSPHSFYSRAYWVVNFYYGETRINTKSHAIQVRLVRTGQ